MRSTTGIFLNESTSAEASGRAVTLADFTAMKSRFSKKLSESLSFLVSSEAHNKALQRDVSAFGGAVPELRRWASK